MLRGCASEAFWNVREGLQEAAVLWQRHGNVPRVLRAVAVCEPADHAGFKAVRKHRSLQIFQHGERPCAGQSVLRRGSAVSARDNRTAV